MFQSTHSLRSATPCLLRVGRDRNVSIHALLVECDEEENKALFLMEGFNPRTPCGVRHPVFYGLDAIGTFQSTHSLRSATRISDSMASRASVSIHALLAECDLYQ